MTETIEFRHPQGSVTVESAGHDAFSIRVTPSDFGLYSQSLVRVTRYPPPLIELITQNKTPLWVCDEIEREEDPGSVRSKLDRVLRACRVGDRIASARILDMGCGCAASTMNLARMAPRGEVVGVELDANNLAVARARAEFYGYSNVRFEQSPSGTTLPEGIGTFDFVVMNAVFEHLLPKERSVLLPALWSRLRPGGVLLLCETPYRYSLFEVHTSGLPLVNFLPAWIVRSLAPRLSIRIEPGTPWSRMLRNGIRGGSPRELLRILGGAPRGAELVEPDPAVNPRWIEAWRTSLAELSGCLRRPLPRLIGPRLERFIAWLHARHAAPLAADLLLGIRKTG